MKLEEKRIDATIRDMIAKVDPTLATALGIPPKVNGDASQTAISRFNPTLPTNANRRRNR